MKRYPRFYVALVVAATLAGLALVSGFEDDSALEQAQYCRMVHAYLDSDGEFGWPDYERTYGDSCNADGTVYKER